MKIAILSPVAWRTPPLKYGPWEQVASNLAEGLVAKGVDVSLFATADSITSAKLNAVCARGYAEDAGADAKVNECLHISNLLEMAEQFDIIHNHFDFLPLTYSRLVNTPFVTTIHGFSSPRIVPVYKKYNHDGHYVAISNADRHPELEYAATIYNGIDASQFSFAQGTGDYLLFFGRIHPHKGTLQAIEIAKLSGRKLVIAGLVQDEQYFKDHIEPAIDGEQVVYAGNCGPAERDALLGGALSLLHPVLFEEPFGLSVAEAMCCGTPVIAFARGAMPELIVHGETGYLVQSVEEAAMAVDQLAVINRADCRKRVMEKFSKEKMVDNYLELYQRVITDK